MTPAEVALLQAGIALAFQAWDTYAKMQDPGTIPTWEELTDRNRILQQLIDAEKKG